MWSSVWMSLIGETVKMKELESVASRQGGFDPRMYMEYPYVMERQVSERGQNGAGD